MASTPLVTVYGATGTFYLYATAPYTATGHEVTTSAVGSWAWPSGKAAGWASLAGGKLFIAGEDLSNAPAHPTGLTETVSVFDPAGPSVVHTAVPTSLGSTSVTGSNGITGGVYGADFQTARVGAEEYALFIPSFIYNGWNVATYGEFPALVTMRLISGTWQVDAAKTKTAKQLHDASSAGALAFPPRTNAGGETYYYDRGMADSAVTPASQHLVICHYFPDGGIGQGPISVIDPSTQTVVAYLGPTFAGDGSVKQICPREVLIDPTGTAGHEPFVLIYDNYDYAGAGTYNAMQEFVYDSVHGTIAAVGGPFHTPDTARRWGQGVIDSDGNLWVLENNGLVVGDMVVFPKISGSRHTAPWSVVVGGFDGDFRLTLPTTGNGFAWATGVEDTTTKTVMFVTGNGTVFSVRRAGTGYGLTTMLLPQSRLEYKTKIENQQTPTSIRGTLSPSQPAVDSANRVMWLPIGQQDSATTCASWPCSPHVLDQWVMKVNLDGLLNQPGCTGTAHGTAIAQTSMSLTIPSDTCQAGDTAFVFADIGTGGTNHPSTPTGWTALVDTVPTSSQRYMVFQKTLAGADLGSTFTLSYSSATNSNMVFAAWRGGDPASVVTNTQSGSATTTVTRPSATVTAGTWRVIGAYMAYNQGAGQTVTPDSGTETTKDNFTSTNHPSIVVTEEIALFAGAGSTTARTATASVNVHFLGVTVALRASENWQQGQPFPPVPAPPPIHHSKHFHRHFWWS
jgi:hypothetical protein